MFDQRTATCALRLRWGFCLVLPLVFSLFTATTARAELYGWWPLDDGSGDEARDLGPRHENGLIADSDTGGLSR